MTVIDVHRHVIPSFVIADAGSRAGPFGLRLRRGQLVHPEGFGYPVPADFVEPDALEQLLREQGIDQAVVSVAPTLFFYEKGEAGVDFASRANEALADVTRRSPVLRALATLPLQDPSAAVAELERALGVGFRGCPDRDNGPPWCPPRQ